MWRVDRGGRPRVGRLLGPAEEAGVMKPIGRIFYDAMEV